MQTLNLKSMMMSVALIASSVSLAAPASAQITQFSGAAFSEAAAPSVTKVEFGGYGGHGYRGRGYGRRGYYGGGRYGRGYYGRGYGYRRGVGAGLAGLAAGAIIGGAIASQAGRAGEDPVAYCQSRFRSYDPASGTYLGNDGARHACP